MRAPHWVTCTYFSGGDDTQRARKSTEHKKGPDLPVCECLDRRQGPRKRPRDCARELSPQACNKKRAGEPTPPVLDNELVVNDNACDFIARDVVVSVFN